MFEARGCVSALNSYGQVPRAIRTEQGAFSMIGFDTDLVSKGNTRKRLAITFLLYGQQCDL